MNTTLDEQELTRWLDGEMNAAELSRFEARLQTNPVMRTGAEAMKQLCGQVKKHFPQMADVPHPDFFNSQIHERIRELEFADQQRQQKASPWLGWLRRPWLILAGATALILLIGHTVFQTDSDLDTATTLLNTYAPDGSIQPRTFHSNDANATVLELDGLEDIPDDSNVVGYQMLRQDMSHRVTQTALHCDLDKTLPVFTTHEAGTPRMTLPQAFA